MHFYETTQYGPTHTAVHFYETTQYRVSHTERHYLKMAPYRFSLIAVYYLETTHHGPVFTTLHYLVRTQNGPSHEALPAILGDDTVGILPSAVRYLEMTQYVPFLIALHILETTQYGPTHTTVYHWETQEYKPFFRLPNLETRKYGTFLPTLHYCTALLGGATDRNFPYRTALIEDDTVRSLIHHSVLLGTTQYGASVSSLFQG